MGSHVERTGRQSTGRRGEGRGWSRQPEFKPWGCRSSVSHVATGESLTLSEPQCIGSLRGFVAVSTKGAWQEPRDLTAVSSSRLRPRPMPGPSSGSRRVQGSPSQGQRDHAGP